MDKQQSNYLARKMAGECEESATQSELDNSLSKIDMLLECVAEKTATLEVRLKAILRNTVASVEKEKASLDACSPLTQNLLLKEHTLERINDQLQEILNRLIV